MGFNVTPIANSLENLNRFTLTGKSALQYSVLALAILVRGLILYALVLCIRTKLQKTEVALDYFYFVWTGPVCS